MVVDQKEPVFEGLGEIAAVFVIEKGDTQAQGVEYYWRETGKTRLSWFGVVDKAQCIRVPYRNIEGVKYFIG